MRNSLSSIDANSWMALGENRDVYMRGAGEPYPLWSSRRTKPKMDSHKRTSRQNRCAFYTLPNGAKVTIEELVMFIPLEGLFKHGYLEFSIEDIRFDAYFRFHLALSWKQVRDALYRLNHGKLLFRHIAKGVYSWQSNTR